MKTTKFILTVLAVGTLTIAKAQPQQSPPVPVEVFTGNTNTWFQMILNKRLDSAGRFSFFNVGTFERWYDNYDQRKNSMTLQPVVFMKVLRIVQIGIGGSVRQRGTITSFAPIASVGLSYANKRNLIVFLPTVDLLNDGSQASILIYQHKIPLNDRFKLYLRYQMSNAFKNYDTHISSYEQIRIGIDYKGFQAGPGITVYQFGTEPNIIPNFGGFIRKELF